ncbi:DNA translocase FtsK [Bacteriovoracaceae bacterium]|nr:DNA translocase FtsK [Bacteriovoracaceae bacterium]
MIWPKRSHWSDLAILPLFYLLTVLIASALFPWTVGKGVLYLIEKIIPAVVFWPSVLFVCMGNFYYFLKIKNILIGNTIFLRLLRFFGFREDKKFEIAQIPVHPGELLTKGNLPVRKSQIVQKIPISSVMEIESEDAYPTSLLVESLLEPEPQGDGNLNENEVQYFDQIRVVLEEKFREFKVSGKIINTLSGPVVNTFELELGAGVKISKVTSISEDLSLALKGIPIRMIYPMEGKSTVGIEVPRSIRQTIYLANILSGEKFFKT